ncbi:MAG TPA: hypothetical protein VFV38_48375 [Ktedonobacteraceae bacterium]|nr:hypothetical protein [Ktedonobacteraceae bacterium]
MVQSTQNVYRFALARQAYTRTSGLTWLMGGGFLLCALLGSVGALLLWPTYTHEFTLYLKWQDALVASCWCITLVSLGGCVLVLRFLHALRQGYKRGMLTLEAGNTLSGRDLSPKNLISIFWAVATTFACFVVMLIGLAPAVLIGWTLHIPNVVLMVFSTVAAFLLSLAGLALSLPFGAFFIIGLVGGISFCRKMGASQTYTLSSQTILRIDGSVLSILHPDRPESLFDLQLLVPQDQRRLLTLLRERWVEARRPWNPALGEEIEVALSQAE